MELYKQVFDKEDTEVIDELENIYSRLSMYIIDRYSKKGKRQIINQNINGNYKLIETDNVDKYTTGGTILNIERDNNLL